MSTVSIASRLAKEAYERLIDRAANAKASGLAEEGERIEKEAARYYKQFRDEIAGEAGEEASKGFTLGKGKAGEFTGQARPPEVVPDTTYSILPEAQRQKRLPAIVPAGEVPAGLKNVSEQIDSQPIDVGGKFGQRGTLGAGGLAAVGGAGAAGMALSGGDQAAKSGPGMDMTVGEGEAQGPAPTVAAAMEAGKPAEEEETPPEKGEAGPKEPQYKSTYFKPNTEGIESTEDILKRYHDDAEAGKKVADAEMQGKLSELQTVESALRKEYKENKDRTAMMEVAEKVGHALAQFGAAQQGLRSGVDLSGLKFDKTNWGEQYNRLLDEMKMELTDLRDKKEGAVKQGAAKTASGEREREHDLSGSLKGREDLLRSAEKEAEGKGREAEQENLRKQRLYEAAEKGKLYRDLAAIKKGAADESAAEREARRKRERDEADAKRSAEARRKEAAKTLAGQEKDYADIEGALVNLHGNTQSKTRAKDEITTKMTKLGATPEQIAELLDQGTGKFWDSREEENKKIRTILDEIRPGKKAAPAPTTAPAAAPATTPGSFRVRLKATGKTGTVDQANFDPATMEKI